jgi:hypothetical protein
MSATTASGSKSRISARHESDALTAAWYGFSPESPIGHTS